MRRHPGGEDGGFQGSEWILWVEIHFFTSHASESKVLQRMARQPQS